MYNEIKQVMATSNETIESLRIEPADNGFKVCWTECVKRAGAGHYDNRSYEYHEEVFKDDEEAQAIGRFKDLNAQRRKGEPLEEEEG